MFCVKIYNVTCEEYCNKWLIYYVDIKVEILKISGGIL